MIQDYGTNLIHGGSDNPSGGSNGRKIWWQERHRDVFKQMDAKQWAELRSLPMSAQNQWMDERMREINTGQPHAAFNRERYGQNLLYGFGTTPPKGKGSSGVRPSLESDQ